jgi:predicted nucleotidyltransferase
MKFNRFLDDIFSQKSKVKALRYLTNHDEAFSVRELSRNIGVTEPNLSLVLKELEKVGVLVSKKYGTSLVFRLNRGHYLVDDLLVPVFKKERQSLDDFSKFIVPKVKTPYLSIVLFGSTARGTEHFGSDLDLLLVIKSEKSKNVAELELIEIGLAVIKKFGNSLSPIVMTKSEFSLKYKKKDKLVRNIVKEGRILAGDIFSEIL